MSLDDFLQEIPPKVSRFPHLFISSAFLALDHGLW
jgi:hypothetical protein